MCKTCQTNQEDEAGEGSTNFRYDFCLEVLFCHNLTFTFTVLQKRDELVKEYE